MMAARTILFLLVFLVIACSSEDLFPCKHKKAVISIFFDAEDSKGVKILEKAPIEGQCPKNGSKSDESYWDISFLVNGSEPLKIRDYLAKGHALKLTQENCPTIYIADEYGRNLHLINPPNVTEFEYYLLPFDIKGICQVRGYTPSDRFADYRPGNPSKSIGTFNLDDNVASLPTIISVSCRGFDPFNNTEGKKNLTDNFEKDRSSASLMSDYIKPNHEDEDFYVGFDVGLPFREGSQNMRSHLERFLANPWAEVEQAYTFEHRAEKTLNESRQLFDIWDKCVTVSVCDCPLYCQKLIMTTGSDCWNDNDADCYDRFFKVFNSIVKEAHQNGSEILESYIQVEMNQNGDTTKLLGAFKNLNSMLALSLIPALPVNYPKTSLPSDMCAYKENLRTIFKTHDELLKAYSSIPDITVELQKIAMKFDYETRTLDRYENWIGGVLAANLFAYGSLEKCYLIPAKKVEETRKNVIDASFKALKSVYNMEHAIAGQHWKFLRNKGIKVIDAGWNKNEIVVKNLIQELGLSYTRVDFMAIVHNNLVPYNEPKKIASYPDTAYDSWALKHSDYPDINYDRFRTVFSNGERGGKSFEIDHRWTSEYYAPIQPNNEKKEAYAELKKRLSALSGDVISVRDQIVKEFKAFLPEEWHVLSVIVMEGAYEPKAMCHKQPDSPHQFVYGVTHEKWFYAVAFWSRVQYEVCNKLPEP